MLVSHLGDYLSDMTTEARAEYRSGAVTHLVEIIDGYLLATVMLILSLGLYELLIHKIDAASDSEHQSSVLLITSLDDLKSRLAKVVLMILIVKFFEHALSMKFDTPLAMLEFAGGIALIGLALYLSHAGDHAHTSAPGEKYQVGFSRGPGLSESIRPGRRHQTLHPPAPAAR